MKSGAEQLIELIPGVHLLDSKYSILSDSNVLVTIVEDEKVTSFHYRNGISQELDTRHLLETQELSAPKEEKKSVKVIKKTSITLGYFVAITLFVFSMFSFSGVIKARIVLTGSMAPAINTGDIIITTPLKYRNPAIGDVIAYQAKRFNGSPVGVFSHRIIGGDINKGFIVKGDSNKLPDSQKPTSNDILGVVIFVIPYIGNLLTPKALFLLVPTVFGFYLIMDAMRNVE